jgi:predicted nuclease of predicted toxin-antitoxin system
LRILLDENLTRRLRHDLVGHDVATVREVGWGAVKNGKVLRRASARFGVLLTLNRTMRYQQNPSAIDLAMVVLAVPDNKLDTLRRLLPDLLPVLADSLQPGSVVVVGNWRVS